jgi:hypothetical protein
MTSKLIVTFVVSLIALSACDSAKRALSPEIVKGNERYLVIRDILKLPGKKEEVAANYCKKHGRIARFQSKGGDHWQCYDARDCTTYFCVE